MLHHQTPIITRQTALTAGFVGYPRKMNTIKVYLDTDAISKLAKNDASGEVPSLIRKQGIEPMISDLTVQEVLHYQNTSRRALIGKFIVDLIQDGPILAPISTQILWGSLDFAEGRGTFRPYRTKKEDWVKRLLLKRSRFSTKIIEELNERRQHEDNTWDCMHAEGRPVLQEMISQAGGVRPTIHDWLGLMDSNVIRSLIVGNVAPEALPKIRGNEARFLEWNPVLCCFAEQLLLAIYRHAIEPPKVASKKGPKFPDYSHGAFAGLVDVFVTDDKRFSRALKQHVELFPKWRYFVCTQTELIRVLDSGQGFGNAVVQKNILPLPSRS